MRIDVYYPVRDGAYMVQQEFLSGQWPGPGAYQHIATIEAGGLEDAYYLTNTIEEYWFEGSHVTWLRDAGARSSMVGDAFVLDGEWYVIDRVGFRRMEVNGD